MLKELDEFLAGIDIAVVGLANCGSCTSWTIHDALRAADTGIPTVAIRTDHFKDLAQTLARRGTRSALRRHILPIRLPYPPALSAIRLPYPPALSACPIRLPYPPALSAGHASGG